MLNITMTNIGPKLSRGMLTLSYLQRREKSGFFGFTSMSEKVYFERWRLSVVVSHSPFLSSRDEAGEVERERARDSCRNQLQLRMLHLFQAANQDSDALPSEYEHEFDVGSGSSSGVGVGGVDPTALMYGGGASGSGRARTSSTSSVPTNRTGVDVRY